MDDPTIFLVNPWMDKITERRKSNHSKRQASSMWPDDSPTFPCKGEAERFIVHRAAEEVVEAERALKKARARLTRCRRNFGGQHA